MNLDVFACLASALATSKHDMQFTPWYSCGETDSDKFITENHVFLTQIIEEAHQKALKQMKDLGLE